MYSNFRIRIYNIPAFWLALVCLLVLLAIQETQQNDTSENAKNNQIPEKKNNEEEFPNLLQLIDATKRVHIVAETVHDGQRTQVEEYLDLSSYNQLVQYKWHEQTTNPHDDKLTTLRTRKFHSLLLNGRDKSIWYHYDQYRCFSADLNENSATSGDLKWTTSGGRSEPSLGAKQNGQQWRPWAGMSSPFLTQLIVKDAAAAGGSQTSRWVSGIAGLWLKIQEASAQEPAQEGNLNGVWRLELAGGIFADVYVEQMARLVGGGSDQGDGAVQYFDAPSLIVLKDKSQKQIQMINVFNIEFNYGNQLAKNLFKLPIGFGCPANSLLTSVATGVYFRDQRSQLMEFELVATRLDALTPVQQQTDVRNIELARARHPMDPEGSLLMFRSLEDRLRIVQDNSYKLEYKIYNLGLARQCGIEHLQFIEGAASKPGGRLASINSIPVELSNGITIDLSEFNMDYVLGLRESDTSHMRLLNVFDIDDSKSELVFEASVPSEHSQMVTLVTTANSTAGFELDSFGDELKLRMIRVYQQEVVKSSVYSKSKIRRGLLEFTRAIIFVFNADASEKLAEIRLNLLEDNHMMSFARRARLFDLSQCHDLEHESIELVVYYPAEPELLQTLSEQSHAILDSFYLSSFDWASKGIESVASGMMPQKTSDGVSDSNQLEVLRKKRLGASLNFLRVPKVELKLGATGELEMHLTILERISPLDLFEHLPNCCFIGDNLNDQTVLVGSLRECARQCLLFNCKVFDYDTGRQCKMSRLPLLVGPPINLASSSTTTSQKNASGEDTSAVELRPTFARLSEDHKCDLYYEPPFIADKHIGEASLAEISSYIEHIAEELDEFMLGESSSSSGDDDDNRPGAGFTIRHKRNVSPLRQPLFVLEFSDRSGQSSGYGPPKTWQLVPSELSIKRLPGVLDVRALAQASRVDHTFGVKAVGRAYNLSALDPPQPTSGTGLTSISANIRHPDERVFRDQHKQVYYTLKKISSISQENCALLCYDLEEFNYRKSGEQICESFSYSKLDEVCILLIKTDFAFVDSILDLVGEGELVLELESKDQLINVNFDGIVTARHYLGRFEGPLPLEENFVGARSTDPLLAVENGTSPVSELTLEWLPALVVEGSHVDDDQGEQCAERCASRNKHPDTGLCLAFDYCFTSNLLAAGVQSAGFSREIRRQQACNLLLVNNNNKELRSKTKLGQISWLRLHLTHATGSSEKATADTGELDTGEGHTKLTSCSRYLVSHLREFNHLNKRQLNKNSDLISKKLEVFSETVLHTDQNLCAMECGGLWAAECLLFEFCQHVTESRSIEQRCTLFKRTSHRNDADDDGSILKPVDNGTDSPTLVLDMAASSSRQSVTSYHDGCHVYLRREFETLEQALSDQALDKILTNQPPTTAGGGVFQHTVMTIWFVVIYSILATAFLTYCLVQRRNRLPKTTTASDSRQLGGSSRRQAPISMIMMEEINNSRARI